MSISTGELVRSGCSREDIVGSRVSCLSRYNVYGFDIKRIRLRTLLGQKENRPIPL